MSVSACTAKFLHVPISTTGLGGKAATVLLAITARRDSNWRVEVIVIVIVIGRTELETDSIGMKWWNDDQRNLIGIDLWLSHRNEFDWYTALEELCLLSSLQASVYRSLDQGIRMLVRFTILSLQHSHFKWFVEIDRPGSQRQWSQERLQEGLRVFIFENERRGSERRKSTETENWKLKTENWTNTENWKLQTFGTYSTHVRTFCRRTKSGQYPTYSTYCSKISVLQLVTNIDKWSYLFRSASLIKNSTEARRLNLCRECTFSEHFTKYIVFKK